MEEILEFKEFSTIDIAPAMPFNFEGTFHKPSHFPSSLDYFEDNCFGFTMRFQKEIYGIRIYPNPKNATELRVEIFSKNPLNAKKVHNIAKEIKYRFDLNADLREFIRIAQKDPVLNHVEKKWRGMRVSCAFSLYELLCITIVLQNAQVRRSVQMLENMLNSYGKKVRFADKELFSFWLPSEIVNEEEEKLRSLKIGYRAKSFLRISLFFLKYPNFEEKIRKLSKIEAAKELLQIYGIGPATCGYILFEKLHHYDALDHMSPWEAKIIGMLLFNQQDVSAKTILKYTNKEWGKWRMLAAHYLFEDVFWRRKYQSIPWLDDLIRL